MRLREVAADEIIDAIKNPLKTEKVRVDEYGRKSVIIKGKSATLILNPDTEVLVTTYKTGSKRLRTIKK